MAFIVPMTKENLVKKLFSVAERIHFRIFGHTMSDEMRKFLGHLSWSFFGGIVAAGIMFVVNILAGRWLGPEEYGKYNFVLAVASFFGILMTLGLDTAAPRFIAIAIKEEERKAMIGFIFRRMAFTSVAVSLFLVVGILFTPFLSSNRLTFLSAITLSFFLSARSLFDGILRGERLFRWQAKLHFIESITIFAGLIFLYFFSDGHFLAYILAMVFGYVIFSSFVLFRFGSLVSKNLSLKKKKTVVRYGRYAFVGAFASFLLTGSDKLLVGSFLNGEMLGLYSAYFTVSVAPVLLLQSIVVNVFFPSVSRAVDGRPILEKINRLFLILFIPVIFFIATSTFIFVGLFGGEYRQDITLSLLFGLYAALFFIVGVKQWFLAGLSNSSILYSSTAALVAGLIQLFFTIFSLRYGHGLYLFIASIIIAQVVFFLLNNRYINHAFKKLYET